MGCRGPVAVSIDGGPPPKELLWKKHLALLVYLVLSPRARSRDHLIGLLWPEKEEKLARHSLNEALRVVRRALPDLIVSEGDLIRVDQSQVRTDLEGKAAAEGDLLEGLSVPDAPEFERWLDALRQKHRSEAVESQIEHLSHAYRSGSLVEAARLAREVLEGDPVKQKATDVLMRSLVLLGDRPQALAVYQQYCDVLEREFDALPDPELEALAERVRGGDPIPGAPGRPEQSGPATPIFGPSSGVLTQILDLWSVVKEESSPSVVVLRGGPGTGKTRLTRELEGRGELDGAVTGRVRCLEGETLGGALASLLRSGLMVPELSGAAPEVLAGLAQAFPDVSTTYPGARNAEPVPPAQALAGAVGAIAEAQPVILVLDDAQDASEELLLGWQVAMLATTDRPVMFVISSKSGPSSAAVDRITATVGSDLAGLALRTEDLDEEGVLELVSWAFPEYEARARERLTRRVLHETAGNPFLSVELVKAVRQGLRLSEESGSTQAWPLPNQTLDQTLPAQLPESVSAALRLRFRSLSQAAQQAAIGMTVLGGDAPIEVLARGTQLGIDELEMGLTELEWERWISADQRGYHYVTQLAEDLVRTEMVTAGQRRRIKERASREH